MPPVIQNQPDRQARIRIWRVALLNILLGIPGLIPVFMVWYLLVNWPLNALGLTEREPTENDGILPGLIVFGPCIAAGLAIWILVNRLLVREPGVQHKGRWILASLMSFVPTVVIVLYVLIGEGSWIQ